ncbi:Scr1 family TA system antitoxin-like transcriptional regulator [Streptomyces sp. NBC_01445]|uniref:Scr1 family TA system antitoxin-like transcriptional regulator n=1 Tax=Streptomyces sp. NBC_01445 TaxID=2903869 RepID=UPI002DD823D7|nr:Scr1 family TA system antitoxin-like transcriptional regulator [Streptomyces sp. NBC_01445]
MRRPRRPGSRGAPELCVDRRLRQAVAVRLRQVHAALHTKVGDHKAMDEQREVPAEAAHRPHLTVQVVPLDHPRTR